MFERLPRSLAVLGATVCFAVPCVAASHAHQAAGKAHVGSTHAASMRSATSHGHASHLASSHGGRGRHAGRFEHVAAVHHEPVPAMDPTRATAIQSALIRAGYLTGEPTGQWDAESVAAMQKLQDDNGWQTKYTPDSRALVKLGLGSVPATAGQNAPAAQPATIAEASPAFPPGQP